MTKRRPIAEGEWLGSGSVDDLLSYLHQHGRVGRVPDGRRLLALFRCACCRAVWDLFDDERCRRAVEVNERAAEGAARRAELAAARAAAERAAHLANQEFVDLSRRTTHASPAWREAYRRDAITRAAAWTASTRFDARVTHIVAMAAQSSRWALVEQGPASAEAAEVRRREEARQADFLRDIFGNPFRPPAPVDPGWLAWNGGAVRRLAQAIRAEGAFDRLPVLADALEEAGCTDADLLSHCRGRGPHVRGCWVIDLLTGTPRAALGAPAAGR